MAQRGVVRPGAVGLALLAAGFVLVAAGPASAQFGIGGRLSFIRANAADEASKTVRHVGGQIRARTSLRTALELSLDYRTTTDPLTGRVRDMPLQMSLLLYPVRSRLSIYLLGGAGWYWRRIETTDPSLVVATRRFGPHSGLGAELLIGRRAAIHLDYRYTFLHYDTPDFESGAVPIPGTGWLQKKLNLAHEGSMWTTGLTVYF